MKRADGDADMSEEKHKRIFRDVASKLESWQRKIRKLTTVVPSRKALPLLTPAEAFGHEIERFKKPEQALTSWVDKQTQWWSFTGQLKTANNRPFSFQLLFFERHLQRDFIGILPVRWVMPDRTQTLGAHFSITDPMNADHDKNFRHWARGGILSENPGFSASDRFHVDVEGWYAFWNEPTRSFWIFANGEGNSLRLELTPTKPLCYHGQSGFSQRAADPSYAAFYCSYTRLSAKGQLLLDGRLHEITGTAWMDHEKMGAWPEAGWDWLSVQFEDGEDLMLFLPESSRGSLSRFAGGTWIDREGNTKHLVYSDLSVENLEYWTSGESQAKYPIKRKIRVQPENHPSLELEVRAQVPAQELDATKTMLSAYWQGAVTVTGTKLGSGHMGLLGYDKRPSTKLVQFLTRP